MSVKFVPKNVFSTITTQEKAALQFGFYWENIDQILEQIKSECLEVKEAFLKKDPAHLKEEVGDLINATISLSIFLGLDPENTLQNNVEKFQKRYDKLVQLVEQDGLKSLKDQPVDVLLSYWNKAKGECA